MAAIVATWLACWLVMALAPRTPCGRWVCRLLVEAPAARLLAITRGDIAIALIVVFAVVIGTTVGETDAFRLLIFAAPDVALWITSLGLSALIEVAVAVAVAVSHVRVRGIASGTRAKLSLRLRRSARARRPGQINVSNDDEDVAAVRLAA